MCNISFIIPCGRIPFENAGKNTVDSILEYHENPEILVCSKEKIDYKNIIYIEEDKNNLGSIAPINQCALKASNEFICLLNDDVYLKHNINIVTENIVNENLIGLTLMPIDWSRFGIGTIPSKKENVPFENIHNTPFVLIRKSFIQENNELVYGKLHHLYGDCSIALKLKKKYNQNKLVYDDNNIYVYNLSNSRSLDFVNHDIDFNIYSELLEKEYNVH